MRAGNAIQYDNPNNDIPTINSLVVELEHYRRQSELLTTLNGLHARLAGAVDLPAMLEAFSVWLSPLINHELMAYQNPGRERTHMICSSHGPERRRIMQIAQDAFERLNACKDSCCWAKDEFYVHNWSLHNFQGSGIILVLKKDRAITQYQEQLLAKGLEIIAEPLQRAQEYEDLYQQASCDSLTGLANRRVFNERISTIIAQAKRHGHPVSLACLDLDKFKQINDTHGHAVGDMVLQRIADVMKSMIRDCDVLARTGGDEFVLILPDTNIKDATVLAERLCRAVDKLDLPAAGSARLGISIGLVEWQQEFSQDQWTQYADVALYQAKAAGRSRVCCWQPAA
ncbi:MAG: GGDEF domain-containing protein [Deltaproteobacteria bacterium]|nr:GGDEF domain-containing protein [Deltaproteobacteria bacterium]